MGGGVAAEDDPKPQPRCTTSQESSRPDLFVTDTAPKLAAAIVAIVFCGFGLLAFSGIAETSGFVDGALSVVYAVAMLALQLGYFSRPSVRLSPRAAYAALVVQACLVYLPILQFGTLWLGFPGFLAGSVLIALPARFAVPVFALIVVSMAFLELAVGAELVSDFYAVTYSVVSTVITGLIVYGLTRLARLVSELHDARDELSRMAVAEERLRFARDVHDLLGMSLSAITLKIELTNRLMTDNPERARAELADMLVISRKTLADVRMVASDRHELSLDEELRSARSVLSGADVDLRIEISDERLPGPIRTVLATVLREGVTNVLRHSKAEWCEISVWESGGEVRMDVVNDGVPREPPPRTDDVGGHGICNLLHRISLVGGELTAIGEPGERFRLSVSVPLGMATSPARQPGQSGGGAGGPRGRS